MASQFSTKTTLRCRTPFPSFASMNILDNLDESAVMTDSDLSDTGNESKTHALSSRFSPRSALPPGSPRKSGAGTDRYDDPNSEAVLLRLCRWLGGCAVR